MFLRELHVKNYMIHQDTKVILQPLTVFVGPNGGGKSALFDALLNFSMVSRGNLRQAFGPYPYSFRSTIYRGASKVSKIGYRVVMARSREDAAALEYEIDYAQSGQSEDMPQFTIARERIVAQPEGTVIFDRSDPDAHQITKSVELENDRSLFAAVRYAEAAGASVPMVELLEYCTQQISRFNKFRIDPSVLGQPSRLPDPSGTVIPRLGYHGEDLAATLYHLSETRDPALATIRERLKLIDPHFDDFDFNTVGTERIAFSAMYSDPRQTVPSVRLSAGTLIFIGLIALVATSNRPPVLMIEEPENGLTPQAVKIFYECVRDLAVQEDPSKRSQVLMSSHSPFVICEAWNGNDRDFIYQVKVKEGRALVRKFSDVITEQGIQLQKDQVGDRTILGLRNAEEVMSGYLS
jgi:predicted ATPase